MIMKFLIGEKVVKVLVSNIAPRVGETVELDQLYITQDVGHVYNYEKKRIEIEVRLGPVFEDVR